MDRQTERERERERAILRKRPKYLQPNPVITTGTSRHLVYNARYSWDQ